MLYATVVVICRDIRAPRITHALLYQYKWSTADAYRQQWRMIQAVRWVPTKPMYSRLPSLY